MSVLWVDKYRPKDLSLLDYHKHQAQQLKNLVATSDFPHLLVFGPSGAGKKTRIMCILRELFGPGVERVKTDHVQVETPSKKKIDITTVNSNYHIEINPSDVGIHDRVVVMDLIKNIAQTQQIATTNNPKEFKVVVLTEVDNLTKDAQHALRRTMEKFSSNCRLILCATSLSPVIPAIQSRCLPIRIPAPSKEEIRNILQTICEKEDFNPKPQVLQNIIESVNGNLRRAILMCESCKVQSQNMKRPLEKDDIPLPDWFRFIKKTAKLILQQDSVEKIGLIRDHLYELLVNGIPPEIILKELVSELVLKCEKKVIPRVVQEAAAYDHRMTQGNKHIVHLEAFVLKFMCIYFGNLKEMMAGL